MVSYLYAGIETSGYLRDGAVLHVLLLACLLLALVLVMLLYAYALVRLLVLVAW
jgi:hypothetical protein